MKKVFALLLTLCLVIGMVPAAVFADDAVETVPAVTTEEAEASTTKNVKVIFKENGTKVGDTVTVTVDQDATTVPESALTAPEGYKITSIGNIGNRNTCFVAVEKLPVEPEAPKSRWIRVEFINAAGAVVATDRQDIEFGRLSMTVTAPEGYDLVDTNNVISIDDNTKTVKVSVV